MSMWFFFLKMILQQIYQLSYFLLIIQSNGTYFVLCSAFSLIKFGQKQKQTMFYASKHHLLWVFDIYWLLLTKEGGIIWKGKVMKCDSTAWKRCLKF